MAPGKSKYSTHQRFTWVWIVFMALFMIELFSYTWCRVQCIRIGYEISRATADHSEGLAVRNNLKIELARLKSPQRIARIARERLGLITPKPEQTIIIP
ncbi:MAG: hypothetical protein DRH32_09455 [Deltaproteobacteria bacterium]|nr:MAG: hypothetical protein DRH32_09455 [Deltaproteobacteria bacterium]